MSATKKPAALFVTPTSYPFSRSGLRPIDVAEATQLGNITAHTLRDGLVASSLGEHNEDSGNYLAGLPQLKLATKDEIPGAPPTCPHG